MNVACTQENLLQGLTLVSHVAGKNSNLPILGNVLLKTENGNLKLSCTNLEIAISTLVRGKVEADGEYTVPAKLLQDCIALLPSGKVELCLKDDVLEVSADGHVSHFKGVSASEFPLIPKLTKERGYLISGAELRQAVNQVIFAVSASDSRPELSGVACFFHGSSGQDRLLIVATDSYRLSERSVPLISGGNGKEARCIVPARSVAEIARILLSYRDEVAMPEQVEWSLTDNQLVLSFGNAELVSRLIEGAFPDYQQIIPSQFRQSTTLSRQELAKSFRAASLFSRQGIYDVRLELLPNGDVRVSSADTGTGMHITTLKGDCEQSEGNQVTLNFRYVSDGLSAMTSERVRLQMIDAMNPVLMTPVDTGGFRYIVMPIRQ